VEKNQSTEQYINGGLSRLPSKRALTQQIECMAEVIQAEKRRKLDAAYSITLSLDDKGPLRLIRYKADCLENLPARGGGAGPGRGAGKPARDSGIGGAGGSRAAAAAGSEGTRPQGAAASSSSGAGEAAPFFLHSRALRDPHPGACAGILGLVRPAAKAEIEDFDDDYSLRIAESIYAAMGEFCTPAGGDCDEGMLLRLCRRVRVFSADGAATMSKTAELMRKYCPNLMVFCRDFSHAIRIACRDPLELEARFGEQWSRLFGKGEGEHSIIGDIMYSDALKARLQACQRRVLGVDAEQGGGLTLVLQHFRYARPRFESFVGPRRKYICLLQAICMLLCSVAGDPRATKGRRDRAEAALEAMTAGDVIAHGLAGDYGEVCLQFLRLFDVSWHDPALTLGQKEEFLQVLQVLFLDGHIVASTPPDAAVRRYFGGEVAAKTLTQIAMEQLQPMRTFYYGSKTKVLWSRDARNDCREALARLQDVVAACRGRIDADLYDRDLLNQLAGIDLSAWAAARGKEDELARAGKLLKRARRVADGLGIARALFDAEFGGALKVAMRARDAACRGNAAGAAAVAPVAATPAPAAGGTAPGAGEAAPPAPAPPDNRHMWAEVLLPEHRERFPNVALFLRFYMAAQDGTGTLERGLGDAVRIFGQHPGTKHAEKLLRVYLEGPDSEEEVFRRGASGEWQFTPFGRECAREWLARHGRRFACYTLEHKGKGVRHMNRRKGTDKAVQAGQRAATAALVAQAARGEGATTIFGDAREAFAAEPSAQPTPRELKNFTEGTRSTRHKKHRLAAGEPAPKPTLRLGGTRLGAKGGPGPSARERATLGQTLRAALRRAATPVYVVGPALPAEQVGSRRVVALASSAGLLVVPALEDLDTKDLAEEPLRAWLCAVASGKSLVARQDMAPDVSAESPVCVRYQQGTRFAAKVRMTAAFANAHKGIVTAIHAYLGDAKNKWKVSLGESPEPGEVKVSSLRGFQDFLLRARRLVPSQGAHGYFRAAAARPASDRPLAGEAARLDHWPARPPDSTR